MGLGRFGIAGCCKCSPDTPTVGETAGPCGWCGYYDASEYSLPIPVPEDKLCSRRVLDSFSSSKNYPLVPWWTFQTYYEPGTTEQVWLRGDYQHLNGGHYCYTAREPLRYGPAPGGVFREPIQGRVSDNGGAVLRLTNLPPFYGSWSPFTYPYTKRYENGLIINSPTDKTDLIPLKQNMSLEFNTPKNQWPQNVWWYQTGNPFPCIFEPCDPIWNFPVASQYSEFLPGPFSVPQFPAFGWNAPGQPPGNGASVYGLHLTAFSVRADAIVPLNRQSSSNELISLKNYLPATQTLSMGYFVGFTGQTSGYEAEGYRSIEIPYQDNFVLKLEVQFDDYPEDNRKCLMAVTFLLNDNVYFTEQKLIAKPGWRQSGSASDEQAFIQSFCPSRVSARNEISGANVSMSSTAPWSYEIIALWSPRQTPRESFWMDSWYAESVRL